MDSGAGTLSSPRTHPSKMAVTFSRSAALKALASWEFYENKKTRNKILPNVVRSVLKYILFISVNSLLKNLF